MTQRSGAVRLRVGIVLAIAILAITCLVQTLACSSSSSGSIVGEWQEDDDGGFTSLVFFNSDGTCGFFESFDGQSDCETDCTYQLNGSTLILVIGGDGGTGESETVDVTFSGNTLTVDDTDGGGNSTTLTRVNSNSSNTCP